MRSVLFALFALVAAPVLADPPGRLCSSGTHGQVECIRPGFFVHDTCQAIEHFATRHGLDPGFFARLIWQESRFDANALSHAGAQGIAQFMPHTAARRGLRDAYNPAEALEHAAAYLAEMTKRFGNPGLAAVGYNGGERRAKELLAGTDGLKRETVDYVAIITGLSHRDWLETPDAAPDLRLSPDTGFRSACYDLARNRRITKLAKPEPRIPKWGVQLAFGTTKSRARAEFRRRGKACSGALESERLLLIWQKSRASPKGGYYMARIGRQGRDRAWDLCRKLKAQGCMCAVYKNR